MKKHFTTTSRLALCTLAGSALMSGLAVAAETKATETKAAETKAAPIAAPAKSIRWVGSLKEINQQANETGKMILAYFFLKGCPACSRLNTETLSDPGITLLISEFVPCGFDYQKDTGMVKAYNVTGYPTIILADAQGKIVDRINTYRDSNEFSFFLAQALAKNSLPRLQKAVEVAPDDVQANAVLAVAYAAGGEHEKAEPLLAKVKQIDPGNAQGYWMPIERTLAQSLYIKGAYRQALPHMEYQMKNSADLAEVAQGNMRLANAYLRTQQPRQAAAPLQAILQTDEKFVTPQQKAWARQVLTTIPAN